jgi:pimeloyl-ACP methyl ester carboxylesterase
MSRHYQTLSGPNGDWQIHYREAGSGPPCVLLHPSPLSSAAMTATLSALTPMTRCIAWDTPGYGYSDPLPEAWSRQDLSPYVEALAAFIRGLELDRPVIYGSATGAQIAIEFSKQYPTMCCGLLLENLALFSAQESEAIMNKYFPDIRAQDDGSHLQQIWDMARRSTRYFPWNDDSPAAERRSAYPDADVIANIVRDYLLAGPDYDRAYRAAFANERPEQLAAVTVPTQVILWDDGLLGEYAQRLRDTKLPDTIVLRRAGTGLPARLEALQEAAATLLTQRAVTRENQR